MKTVQQGFEFRLAATEQDFRQCEAENGKAHRRLKGDNTMPGLLGNEERITSLHAGIKTVGFGKILAQLWLLGKL